MPAWKKAFHRVLQTLRERGLPLLQFLVTRILRRVPGIGFLQGRGADVVTPTPDFDLLLPELFRHLSFVKALQGAVMPFVEAPVPDHGYPHEIHLVQDEPKGAYRPLQ